MLKIVTTIEVSTERKKERGRRAVSPVFSEDVQILIDRTGVDSLFLLVSQSRRESGERTNVVVSLDVLRRSHSRWDGSVPAVCEKGRISSEREWNEGDER